MKKSSRFRPRRDQAFVVIALVFACLLGLALAVSASGTDPGVSGGETTSDNVPMTMTTASPDGPDQQGQSDLGGAGGTGEAPAPEQPAAPPERIDLPPNQRWLTPAEAREYIPPGEEDTITTGVVVQGDPSRDRKSVV